MSTDRPTRDANRERRSEQTRTPRTRTGRAVALAAVAALAGTIGVLSHAHRRSALSPLARAPSTGAPVPSLGRASVAASSIGPSWQATVQQRIADGEYAFRSDVGGFRASNRAQHLVTHFDGASFSVTDVATAGDPVRLATRAFGRLGDAREPGTAALHEGACPDVNRVDERGECLRRIEARRGNLVEWWSNGTSGLEHGYTIDARVPGSAALVVELDVHGAAVEIESGTVARLRRPHGEPLRYASLHAVDARGRDLPATFRRAADGLAIEVDDRDAAYPVVIDPLITSGVWTHEVDQAGARFGYAVAGAGDVNGDGYGDVVVGAPYYNGGLSEEGAVFVFHGSQFGLVTVAAATRRGLLAGGHMGTSVASAGDVNGDGYGDVITGAPDASNGEASEGRAYVFLGSATGLAATASWTTESNQASAGFGSSVAGVGDVDGDGLADVAVGAPFFTNGTQITAGRVFLYRGSATGLGTSATSTLDPGQSNALFGISVAGAGDVNGDGLADLVVGAQQYTGTHNSEGGAFVYLGSASGFGTAAWTVTGGQNFAALGTSVATAGDVDGDGYSDVVVGVPLYAHGQANEGRALVYRGSSTGLAATPAWSFESDQASAQLGGSVACAGDVNGDGYADVVVGAPQYDAAYAGEGRVFVFLGGAGGLSTTPLVTVDGGQPGAKFGWSVASAGDFDGDGFGDVLAGAWGASNGQTGEGRAQAMRGSPATFATGPDTTVPFHQDNALLGTAVASAGDVNGDGYGDVVVTAPSYDNGQTDEGAAFVYLGTNSGLATTAAWRAESDVAAAGFGSSAASAGDVNSDGYGDLVVGASLLTGTFTNEGKAYVYLGGATGLATTPAWTTLGGQAGANLGSSVASAGDVNGDGYGDVVVGAPGASRGQTSEGRAFVYLGSEAGLATSAAWSAEPDQVYANFGRSVACAGDVNGDGFSDVVVGADGWDLGTTFDVGAAYLYAGSATGLAATASWNANATIVNSNFGHSVASAGDVNGDGYDDLVIGAPGSSHSGFANDGRASIFLGSASGPPLIADAIIDGNLAAAKLGASVAGLGDINGDGYGDVALGSPGYSNGQANEGRVLVYAGTPTGHVQTNIWGYESNQAGAQLGNSVACAGDVNADGFADLLAGASQYSNGGVSEGIAMLFLGNEADGATRGVPLGAQLQRPDATTPVQPLGRSRNRSGVTVAMLSARSPIGVASAKLETEVVGGIFPFTGMSTRSTTWTSTTPSGTALHWTTSGLSLGAGYHWRARLLYRANGAVPWLHSRWVSGGPDPRAFQFRTSCDAGLAGATCQYGDETTCRGHGTAADNGSCACATGFTGTNCASCAASYFDYPTCTFCDATVSCSGHGACSATGSCSCATGFDGTHCAACATNYYGYPTCTFCDAVTSCGARGTCTATGACACMSGYVGSACQYSDATTCNSHGTASSAGSCACTDAFSGPHCDTCSADRYGYPTCAFCDAATTCNGHGACSASGCGCAAGYAGSGCQFGDATTCNGHGVAQTDGSCVCTGGFTGTDCRFSASATCSGHGAAQVDGSCACSNGFDGAHCDACAANYHGYPTCTYCNAATNCGGHGACTATAGCACTGGYVGANCQYSNGTTCNGHGTASATGSCACDDGFDGTSCGECTGDHYNYPSCTLCTSGATCHGHGSCTTSGTCNCTGGFTGATCDTCAADRYGYPSCTLCTSGVTCHGHGACDATGGCACAPGFTGTGCQTACPAGSSCAGGGATPVACAAGSYSTGGASSCVACSCNDGDPCTIDSCEPTSGACGHFEVPSCRDAGLDAGDALVDAQVRDGAVDVAGDGTTRDGPVVATDGGLDATATLADAHTDARVETGTDGSSVDGSTDALDDGGVRTDADVVDARSEGGAIVDGAVDAAVDGGTGVAPPAGCGCVAAGGRNGTRSPTGLLLLAAVLAIGTRRRSRANGGRVRSRTAREAVS